jgi:hypothetical protein
MADRIPIGQWVSERVAADDRLYERYGRPLEAHHRGEFVAIGDDGQTILGLDELEVSKQAIERFGSGRFALRRIGADAEGRWRLGGLAISIPAG